MIRQFFFAFRFFVVLYRVMAKTISQVRGGLRKRASKISSSELLFIVNHLVWNDIREDVYAAFYDEFKSSAKITIVSGTYSYTIAADYEDVISVKDSSGADLDRVYEADEAPVSGYNKRYWIKGNKIYFPKQQIDDLDYKVGEEIFIDYLKRPAEIANENEEIPFEDSLQSTLFPVYVTGAEFFFFGRNKKITDQALARNDYQSTKLNVFSRFV